MVVKSSQKNASVSKISEKNLEINELDKTKNKTSLDDNQIIPDPKTIIPETDKQEVLIKNKENNIGIKNLENKKSKSNFI